jgi:zinc transporter ZupT
LRRRAGAAQLSDIATVSGAVGGAVVTTFPFDDPDVFGAYAIGLAAGFFLYLVVSLALTDKKGRERVAEVWMGEDE